MKRHLKRALEVLLVPVAAAVVFFEDVLLHYLGLAMAAIARWPPIARIETWLAGLPPWAALIAFVAPSTLVLPVKLAAVWFAMQGKFVLATGAIVLGKVVATALVARLYKILRPTLLQLSWYLRAETWLFDFRDRVYGFVRALPAWQAAAKAIRRTKAWLAELVSGVTSR
ncbi:MAG: hypothetical protein LCH93_08015 [Proteobacteria bacterium]|nr:hypothetical protein [Pseudomonadota bacterium]